MSLLWLLSSLMAFANVPLHWSHILEVTERHEFYQNHEPIMKPSEAWQVLFAVTYIDSNLIKFKDCVMFKVPGSVSGILKVKSIVASSSCDEFLLGPGDVEIKEVKSLQFSTGPDEAEIIFSVANFKTTKWKTSTSGFKGKSLPGMSVSSAEVKGPKIILLASKLNTKTDPSSFLNENTLCHNINEDCIEVGPFNCSRCERGWHEVPNGCKTGPKYCGLNRCGEANLPACRRGIVWQKNEVDFDCRTNSSFAYCRQGLQVSCEGRKAYCR
jgi:hypothetical protein